MENGGWQWSGILSNRGHGGEMSSGQFNCIFLKICLERGLQKEIASTYSVVMIKT